MTSMSRYVALSFAGLAFVSLAACTSKPNLREPASLQSLDKPSVALVSEWEESVGTGPDTHPSGLRAAIAADAIFAADTRGNVQARDPNTGRKIWEVATKSRVISGPTVADELILVGTLDGDVIALQRASGALAWRAKVSSEVLAPPVAEAGVVVARSIDGRAYGLSAKDGSRIWAFDRTEPNLTLRGLSAPLIVNGRVFLGMDSGRLVAIDLKTGKPQWEQAIALPSGRSEVERLTDIDANLLATDEGILAASYGSEVALVDPRNGENRWQRTIKSDSGMAIFGDKVAVTDADGVIWALDAQSGAALWKNETLKFRRLSAPAVFNGNIVFGDMDGYLHVLSPQDGSIIGRKRVGRDPIVAAPVNGDKFLYVLNVDGRLAALSTR